MSFVESTSAGPETRAAGGRVLHYSGRLVPLDAKALEDKNPHPPGTLNHVNFNKAYYKGATEADTMSDQVLGNQVRATVEAFTKATQPAELATHEGRLAALANEQALRQKAVDDQNEQMTRQKELAAQMQKQPNPNVSPPTTKVEASRSIPAVYEQLANLSDQRAVNPKVLKAHREAMKAGHKPGTKEHSDFVKKFLAKDDDEDDDKGARSARCPHCGR